jgi:hypothetical protein
MSLCMFCDKCGTKRNSLISFSINTIKKAKESAELRKNHGDKDSYELVTKLFNDESSSKLCRKNLQYHHSCYSNFISRDKIERVQRKSYSMNATNKQVIFNIKISSFQLRSYRFAKLRIAGNDNQN